MSLKKAALLGLSMCLAPMLNQLNADEISLPIQNNTEMTYGISKEMVTDQVFADWLFVKDNVTGDIRQGFGTAINFPEFGEATKENVVSIADKFFSLYGDQFKIDKANIRLYSKFYANNRWHLKFKQYYNNMEVLFSDISIVIFKNGNVMSAGAEYYDNIDIQTTPKITYAEAVKSASKGIEKQKVKDVLLSKPKVKILPIINAGILDYKLVYEHQYKTSELSETFTSYVDANSGDVVWRFGNAMDAQKEVTVKGEIKEFYSNDEPTVKAFPQLLLSTTSDTFYTDGDGNAEINGEGKMTAYLRGKYVAVYDKSQNVPDTQIQINPNSDKIEFEWNDDNSTLYERSLYYHTNIVHQYFKSVDSNQTFMDFPIDVFLQSGSGGPNAASAGDYIYFMNVDNPEAEMAGSGSVLYHEYGHSMNYFIYRNLSSQEGMINRACNEALADITSCAILDDPLVGVGVFTEDRDRFIRNIDNNNRYPEDVQGESHHDGQILSGALWDLYKLTDKATLNKVSHFAKYYTPDDIVTGNAFSEWFLACIQADDDDGNLGNGTPHIQEIITAFNKHNIGISILTENAFHHDPQVYYDSDLESYDIECTFELNTNLDFLQDYLSIESVEVVWSDWRGGQSHTTEAEKVGNEYIAKLPAQETGNILRYHFNIKTSVDNSSFRCTSSKAVDGYDLAFIGYEVKFFDDFEEDKGWILGDDDDDATQGEWERAIPEEVLLGNWLLQPGEDLSEDGDYCLVTGAEGEYFANGYANGITTVTSPKINLTNAIKPILEFNYWGVLMSFSADAESISADLMMSDDNGMSWTKIKTIEYLGNQWNRDYLELNDYVSKINGDVQFKIVGKGTKGIMPDISVLEMLVDDFKIIDLKSDNSVTETGIAELKIFPNPVSTNLSISAGEVIDKIEIVDILGNLIYTVDNIESNQFNWSVADSNNQLVSSGAYFVKIYTANGFEVEKIIVE